MLDLPAPYRQELMRIVRHYAPGHEVLAFGSRLTPDHHAGSDLDIALRHPTAPDRLLEPMGALREAISESNIPILVDVHDWARLPPSFHEQILKRYEVLS